MKITRQYMRECKACYNDEKISLLIPENGCSALDILMLDIPLKDKIWVMTRKGIIEKSIMTIWLDNLVARSKQYAADANAAYAYAADAAADAAAYAYAYAADDADDASADAAADAREQEREKQVDDFIQLLKGLENE